MYLIRVAYCIVYILISESTSHYILLYKPFFVTIKLCKYLLHLQSKDKCYGNDKKMYMNKIHLPPKKTTCAVRALLDIFICTGYIIEHMLNLDVVHDEIFKTVGLATYNRNLIYVTYFAFKTYRENLMYQNA